MTARHRAACLLHLIIYEAMLVPAYHAGIFYARVCMCVWIYVCLEREGLLTSLFFCSRRDKTLFPPAWIFPFIFCIPPTLFPLVQKESSVEGQ